MGGMNGCPETGRGESCRNVRVGTFHQPESRRTDRQLLQPLAKIYRIAKSDDLFVLATRHRVRAGLRSGLATRQPRRRRSAPVIPSGLLIAMLQSQQG